MAKHKEKHIVLISIDALNSKDLSAMRKMTYFSQLIKNGTTSKKAVGVYPSLTYPSHASIITGCYPAKHGIYDNKPCDPFQPNVPWFFYDKDIKVETLYSLLKQNKYTVGSLFWPVTAGACIDYNCPPIWPTLKRESQIVLSLKNGSPLLLYDINKKFGWIRNGLNYPNLDNFTALSAAYILKKHKPNLLMVGFSELDHERHVHGFYSNQANKSLLSTNERVGLIVQAAKDIGIYDNTTFVVLGDHGFLDFEKNVSVNRLFSDNALLYVDNNGNVTDWEAYGHSAGGSIQIYLKNPLDKLLHDKVYKLLVDFSKSKKHGIERIYTKEEAKKKGVVGCFSFVIEAKKGYHFVASAIKPLVEKATKEDCEVATHGYDPNKDDYYTMTIFSGHGIKKEKEIDSINLIDVAPTLAHKFGLNLPSADGKVLYEILE